MCERLDSEKSSRSYVSYLVMYLLYILIVCVASPFTPNSGGLVIAIVIAIVPAIIIGVHFPVRSRKTGDTAKCCAGGLTFVVMASLVSTNVTLAMGLGSLREYSFKPTTLDGATPPAILANPNTQLFTGMTGAYDMANAGVFVLTPSFKCACDRSACHTCWPTIAVVPLVSTTTPTPTNASLADLWMVNFVMTMSDTQPAPTAASLLNGGTFPGYAWRFRRGVEPWLEGRSVYSALADLTTTTDAAFQDYFASRNLSAIASRTLVLQVDITSYNKKYTGYVIGSAVGSGVMFFFIWTPLVARCSRKAFEERGCKRRQQKKVYPDSDEAVTLDSGGSLAESGASVTPSEKPSND